MSKEEQIQRMKGMMAKFIAHTGKKLPDDVITKLRELRDKEDSPLAKTIYDTMFRNQELAVKLNRPSCQDTGVLQFWVKCGTAFPLINEFVFCQVLFPEKSVGIPFFQQGIFPAFSGHYASLRMRACSIR